MRGERRIGIARRILLGWLMVLSGLTLTACQSSRADPPANSPSAAADQVLVAVSSNGWHTSITVPRASLPAGTIPEAADFPQAVYLSFGWGDAEYYPEPDPGVGLALRAALQPSPAVLHVTGLRSPAREAFSAQEVLELPLDVAGFAALAAYIDASFDRGGAVRANTVGPGLYRHSFFYPATGSFHLFNTCNTWSAGALRAGGMDVEVTGTLRAEDLMAQLREIYGH